MEITLVVRNGTPKVGFESLSAFEGQTMSMPMLTCTAESSSTCLIPQTSKERLRFPLDHRPDYSSLYFLYFLLSLDSEGGDSSQIGDPTVGNKDPYTPTLSVTQKNETTHSETGKYLKKWICKGNWACRRKGSKVSSTSAKAIDVSGCLMCLKVTGFSPFPAFFCFVILKTNHRVSDLQFLTNYYPKAKTWLAVAMLCLG